ncbi:hypothetical protein DNTS_023502 [Danionella cerebrum]|uniref:Seipin n=1 Tax=Danionella cerebrum TaxID=2873325 RepID=A0A553MWJ5_9TELE|nr:hypothetical protein DNTS_023502 [Danionella translucida]TRY57565.1 hypothetical protein DNTS_023502 [Danionella translucida]TRY57566.1 hypothetical protein DNTS_023502 [Danionella translucida]
MTEEEPAGLRDRPPVKTQPYLRQYSEGFSTMGAAMGPVLLWLQDVAAVTLLRARRTLLRAAILLCVLMLLLWVSIFLYGSFYYSYMPTVSFSTPVHYFYRTDCDGADSVLCSFPMANVSLLKNGREQVMMLGQVYRISLELEMPESPVNEQLGMFMVKMSCYTSEGTVTHSVSRSTMLHYRSSLLQSMSTVFFSPLLLSGISEQKQLIEVELLPHFTTDPYHPVVGAVIEIQYLLYNFPVMSAVVGVLSNFTFLCVIVLFSYLQFIWGGLYPPEQVRVKVMMADSTRLQQRREDARKRMHSSASTPVILCTRDGSELEDPFQGPKQTVRNKAQDSTAEEAPIFLEAPRITETGLNEEHADSASREGGNMTEIKEDDSDTSLRHRHGPWMRL